MFASFVIPVKNHNFVSYTRSCYTMGFSKLLVIPVLLILPKNFVLPIYVIAKV